MFPRWAKILLVIVAAIVFGHRPLVEIGVDWLWFDAASHGELFTTKFQTQLLIWISFFFGTMAFMLFNLRYSLKHKPISIRRLQEQFVDAPIRESQIRNFLKGMGFVVVLIPALLVSSVATDQWIHVLSYFNSEDFGVQDAVFGHDLSFYFFKLPFLMFVQGSVVSLLTLCLLMLGALTVIRDVFLSNGAIHIEQKQRQQFLVLGGMLFLLMSVGWFFDRYQLLYDREGVVWGAGYTDINARIPAYFIMLVLAIGVAGSLFRAVSTLKLRVPLSLIVIYVVARILLTNAWPSMIQNLMVEPNELDYEREYLEQNIMMTRAAYALERIETKDFPASTNLTKKDIDANPLTIQNVRIWDDRPLLTTYSQIQEIRTYYDFNQVDVDRYKINDQLRQVMLSVREINPENLDSDAKTWVNQHLVYTHGYGVTLSPVNVVTSKGLPDLFIKDIPPVYSDEVSKETQEDLRIDRPEIYYGEQPSSYVIVGGTEKEFDYPTEGEINAETTYAGKGGVDIGSFSKQLLFSLYFKNIEMLFAQQIGSESKILFRRDVNTRLRKMMPFLHFDQDPYLVIADGRLVWMVDAYTISDRFPYSEPVTVGARRYNYVRNAVKATMDAYDGEVNFYVADDQDPMIKVYQKIFPNTFRPLDEMPKTQQSHIRYPVDFFNVQAQMFRAYHMTNTTVFYNKEDMWTTPKEKYDGQEQLMNSYYLVMKFPDSEQEEFVLLLPYVPKKKDNMIAWLAARSDGENYGKLVVYQFPKKELIFGPRQIEARIDQDPEISQEITLWSQSGSRVVRGNLLVIPIEDSLIYVEPLYLQAETSQLPEIKRIIVAYDEEIAMEPTLKGALEKVFGFEEEPSKETTETINATKPSATELPSSESKPSTSAQQQLTTWQAMAKQAKSQLASAEQSQQVGDWAAYGTSLKALRVTLDNLSALGGQDSQSSRTIAFSGDSVDAVTVEGCLTEKTVFPIISGQVTLKDANKAVCKLRFEKLGLEGTVPASLNAVDCVVDATAKSIQCAAK